MPILAAERDEEVEHEKNEGDGERVGVEVKRTVKEFRCDVVAGNFDGINAAGDLINL